MSYSHDNPRKIPKDEVRSAGSKSWVLPFALILSGYCGGYIHDWWRWTFIAPAVLAALLTAGRIQVWFLMGSPTLDVFTRELKWRKPRPEYLNAVPRDRL